MGVLNVGAAVTAVVAVTVSGCAGTTSGSGGPAATGGDANTSRVLIDGKDQQVRGATRCVTADGVVKIAFGGPGSGMIGAVLTDASPPAVRSVGLGDVNGMTLTYTAGPGNSGATVTKNGNTYTITGTATTLHHAGDPVQTKPFEIDAHCP